MKNIWKSTKIVLENYGKVEKITKKNSNLKKLEKLRVEKIIRKFGQTILEKKTTEIINRCIRKFGKNLEVGNFER